VGTEVVVVTATDASGNSGTCSFTVTVLDAELPTVQCPPAQFANTEPGICSAVVNFNLPSGDDNCGVTSVQSFPASGSVFARGTTIVTVVVTDENNNTNSCTFTVNVLDTEPPVAICPPSVTVDTDPGLCSAVVAFNTNLSTDNCPGVTVSAVPASGSVFAVGTTVVVITATDASGNSDTCQFTVTVEDNEAPVALCPANITVDNDPGECGADVSFVLPAPTDNCGATSTPSIASGSFFEVGTEVVVVTATDASGNSGSCSFTVTVLDAELPTVQCAPALRCRLTLSLVFVQQWLTFVLPAGDDNCGSHRMSNPPRRAGRSCNRGTTTRDIVAVTDESNNTNSCTFAVTVLDAEPPVAMCALRR
jgi:large repetitive protein